MLEGNGTGTVSILAPLPCHRSPQPLRPLILNVLASPTRARSAGILRDLSMPYETVADPLKGSRIEVMPRSNTRKKPIEHHLLVAIRVERYEVRTEASINHHACHP